MANQNPPDPDNRSPLPYPTNPLLSLHRSSYAAVLAGGGTLGSGLPTSGLANSVSASELPPTISSNDYFPPSVRSMLADPNMSNSMRAPSQTRSQGRHDNFSNHGADYEHDDAEPSFLEPSYLRNSRYMDRLLDAHNRKLQRLRLGRAKMHLMDMNGSLKGGALKGGDGRLSTSSSGLNLQKAVLPPGTTAEDIFERSQVETGTFSPDIASPLPSKWNRNDIASGLSLSGLEDSYDCEVTFATKSKSPHDDGVAVRANNPIPPQCGIYYYEVTVLSKGREGLIGIGFSGPKVPLNRLPGWETNSWAYHGDDGYSFACSSAGQNYGPKFSTSDTIGCGINFRTRQAFFTKNGHFLGMAFEGTGGDNLYPSVGMRKQGEHLSANFGQEPFIFNIDALVKREKDLFREKIGKCPFSRLQPGMTEKKIIQELLAQYFAHDGCMETLKAFEKEIGDDEANIVSNADDVRTPSLTSQETKDACNRQKIRNSIVAGDIDEAFDLTEKLFPAVMRKEELLFFQLRCFRFIEMKRKCIDLKLDKSQAVARSATSLRKSRSIAKFTFDSNQNNESMEVDNANDTESMDTTQDEFEMVNAEYDALQFQLIQYGQELAAQFASDERDEVKAGLEGAFALLALPDDVSESRDHPLLSLNGRTALAEELNAQILKSQGKPSSAALERVCQQTEVLLHNLSKDGGFGAFTTINHDFLKGDAVEDGNQIPFFNYAEITR